MLQILERSIIFQFCPIGGGPMEYDPFSWEFQADPFGVYPGIDEGPA